MRFWIAALSVATLLVSGNAALADKRVAFVVGNAAYRNVPQLPNPAIDARAIAAVLRNVGFEVVEGTNLTRDKMTERLLDFGKKAQGADVAVFFYAGHGIEISGTNYLLPIDADIKSEMDVKLGAADRERAHDDARDAPLEHGSRLQHARERRGRRVEALHDRRHVVETREAKRSGTRIGGLGGGAPERERLHHRITAAP